MDTIATSHRINALRKREVEPFGLACHLGALIIRKGLGRVLYYKHNKEPPLGFGGILYHNHNQETPKKHYSTC